MTVNADGLPSSACNMLGVGPLDDFDLVPQRWSLLALLIDTQTCRTFCSVAVLPVRMPLLFLLFAFLHWDALAPLLVLLHQFWCDWSDLTDFSPVSRDGFQIPLPLSCLTLFLHFPHTPFIFLLPQDTSNMVSAADSSCSESCLRLKFKNRWTQSILDAVPISTTWKQITKKHQEILE